MLFGQRLKLYGELYANGEATAHPDAADNATQLHRRLQIRGTCKQTCEIHAAKELLRKAASDRTRHVESTAIGDMIFFYRRYPTKNARALQAQRGCWLGPGVVIGHQGQNAWVSFAGRCYLVAPEHLRGLAPDGSAATRPIIRDGLAQIRAASESKDFLELTQEEIPPEEVLDALERPVDNDDGGDALLPSSLVVAPGTPQVLPAEPMAQDDVDVQLEQEVQQHLIPPNATDAIADETSAAETKPTKWKHEGSMDNLKWKRARYEHELPQAVTADVPADLEDGHYSKTTTTSSSSLSRPYYTEQPCVILYGTKKPLLTEKGKKKMLDREVPWDKIPPAHRHLYEAAEKVEWDDWIARGSVRVCTLNESRLIEKKFDALRTTSEVIW